MVLSKYQEAHVKIIRSIEEVSFRIYRAVKFSDFQRYYLFRWILLALFQLIELNFHVDQNLKAWKRDSVRFFAQ